MEMKIYKGYEIKYNFTDKWVCQIWAPNSGTALDQTQNGGQLVATEQEGTGVLLERAHALIDKLAAKSL
jgi:hypothetical protein